MNVTEKLLNAAQGCSAVAFDVFDTLLKRDVSTPAALFALPLFPGDFATRRRQAERQARAAANGEITLAQIYASPLLKGENPQNELDAELAACTSNPAVMEAARACHARGQKIYAVSDMYLPASQIETMLRHCGADFLDGVFVSSEYGVQKRSGGLFRAFLHATGLNPKQVLFVGDDFRADRLGAALAGIRSVGVPEPEPPIYTEKGNLSAFVRNRQGSVFYETLGPPVTAFARWVGEQRRRCPQMPLLFLARDMELVYRVYRQLCPQDDRCGYLRVSRRSLCPALLAAGQYVLAADALPRQELTAGQIARYCGADIPDNASRMFSLRQGRTGEVVDFLQTLTVDPEAVERTLRYLQEQGVGQGTLLVDIGSGGTIQRLLEGLCGVSLQGLYLACDERLDHSRARVFLFDGQSAPLTYWAAQPVLEKLISEPCGPTLGYREENGRVFPLCGHASMDPVCTQAHRDALRFAVDWKHSILYSVPLTAAQAIQPFLRMMQSPRLADAVRLGNLILEDGDSHHAPAARPRRRRTYLFRPGQFWDDLHAARWKVGFLRRVFRLPLPYDRLYAAWKGGRP